MLQEKQLLKEQGYVILKNFFNKEYVKSNLIDLATLKTSSLI